MNTFDKLIVIAMIIGATVASCRFSVQHTDIEICKLKSGVLVEGKCLVDKEIK